MLLNLSPPNASSSTQNMWKLHGDKSGYRTVSRGIHRFSISLLRMWTAVHGHAFCHEQNVINWSLVLFVIISWRKSISNIPFESSPSSSKWFRAYWQMFYWTFFCTPVRRHETQLDLLRLCWIQARAKEFCAHSQHLCPPQIQFWQ